MIDMEDIDESMRFMLERALALELRVSRGMAKKMVGRWLDEVKAEAWDEGKRDGLRQSDWEHGDTPTMHVAVNPYRQGMDA